MKFLQLNFIPRSSDLALLLLRVLSGLLMLLLHGWGKLANFSTRSETFADPFGVGSAASLVLVIFAEVVCAALVVVGAFTRLAALILAVPMAVAFWVAHDHRLTGAGNGELAFFFMGVYIVLFLAGAGRYSVDAKLGARA
jgi:putative oxidoreductase